MASVQEIPTPQLDVLMASMLGTGQPIGQQMQQAQTILDSLRNECSQNQPPFSKGNWDAVMTLGGLLVHPAEGAYTFYALNERLDDAESMLKDLTTASEQTAEEARKWCEEYLQNEGFCSKLKNYFLPWKKQEVEQQVRSWEKAAKKDSLKTINDMKREIEGARLNYIHRKIQFDSFVCILSAAVSVYRMWSDVTTIRSFKKELPNVDTELADIEQELRKLGDDINQTVMQMTQNVPLSESLPMIAWRATCIRQRTTICIGKLTAQRDQLTSKRNANAVEATRNVGMSVIKGFEAAMTGKYLESGFYAIANLAVPAIYGAMGVGHMGVAAYCHSALVQVEARLQKGEELQVMLDKKIKQLGEWIQRFSPMVQVQQS